MPITDLSKPWAQDYHCPNERPKNRHQTAHSKRFTQEQRRTQSHIYGRQVIHGRHIRDWNAGHGIKPKGHRDCVHNAAKRKNGPQPVQPARAAHRGDHGNQENQTQHISQKRRFSRRNAGACQFYQRRHPDKQEACNDHPTNPDQGIFGG